MFEEFKKLPEEQKKLLATTVTISSISFLAIVAGLFFYKEEAMQFLGFDSTTIDVIAVLLSLMVAADLLILKYILGEEKAK